MKILIWFVRHRNFRECLESVSYLEYTRDEQNESFFLGDAHRSYTSTLSSCGTFEDLRTLRIHGSDYDMNMGLVILSMLLYIT